MGTEQDKEKLFSQELDRLLAGNEPKAGPDADADLRSTLEFAHKMTEIRRQPDPVFSARLKAELLHKLAVREQQEREAKEHSWFRRIIPRNPAWQAAAALLVILMIFGITWAAGHFNQNQPITVSVPSPIPPVFTAPAAAVPATTVPATTTASAKPAATSAAPTLTSTATAPTTVAPGTSAPALQAAGIFLQAGANTDKTVYSTGEDVKITVSLTNINSQTIRLDQFPPLSLMRADTKMPAYTFASRSDTRTLAPYETASYTFTWNQLDFKGAPVASGLYYVELEDLDYQGRSVQLNLPQPVTFDILPKY
jgi:hypothetical protein